MKRLTTLAACMMAIAPWTPAAAQSVSDVVVMRRQIARPAENFGRPYTYTATYGAWGACTGGNQTQEVSTCTRSDGKPADISACGAAPTRTCTMPSKTVCNPLEDARGTTSRDIDWPTLGSATTAAGAKAMCEAYAIPSGVTANCRWEADQQVTMIIVRPGGYSNILSGSGIKAGRCWAP